MNDVTKPTRTTDGIRRDIEDNYPDYPEDEYGYTYDAWDLLTLRQTDRHDTLLESSPDELEALEAEDLDDLELLAVARAYRRHGDRSSFVETCRAILESDARHAALVYPEVAVFAARELAIDDKPGALAWLEDFDELAEDLMETRILRAVLESSAGDASPTLDAIVAEYEDEPEMYFEVADEFARQSAPALAREWVEKAREKARSLGDRATLIDIELLASELSTDQTPDDES